MTDEIAIETTEEEEIPEGKKGQNVHFMSGVDPWETPQDLFDDLNEIFAFELDTCADEHNAKCEKYISEEIDAFKTEWKGCCWMNPPYGRKIGRWIQRARDSAKDGTIVVCLLPARTDTKWFQTVWDAQYIVFVHGRLKFGDAIAPAPFPSVIAVFGDEKDLPPDRELTFLTEHGTVVRPIWKHSPIQRIRYDKKICLPFVGTVMEYRRARDPEYRNGCPEERAFAKVYDVKELKDVEGLLLKQDNEPRGCEILDETAGEPNG